MVDTYVTTGQTVDLLTCHFCGFRFAIQGVSGGNKYTVEMISLGRVHFCPHCGVRLNTKRQAEYQAWSREQGENK